LYNHSDLLDSVMKDGSRGLLYSLASPKQTSGPASADVVQLKQLVSQLANQVDSLNTNQRQSHSIIVQSSQPTSLLGVPLWKAAGFIGVAGTIYMKVYGYEFRDLVYVSKKHFDTATAALKDQYDQLEIAVSQVKGELLVRMGMVEKKLDDTRESIHLKITSEVHKVDQRISGLTKGVSQVDARMAQAGLRIDAMAQDMSEVRDGLRNLSAELDARLDPVRREIVEFQEQSSRSQKALSQEMGTMQSKIDDLSRSTTALHFGLERQSKGITLLVEYASRSSASSPDLVDALQTYTKEESNDNKPKAMNPPRTPRRPSEGLAGVKFVTA